MSDEQKPEPYVPDDGLPGPKEIDHRREAAIGILRNRGLSMGAAAPAQLSMLLSGIARLLKHRGIVQSDGELQYFIDLAAVEGLEAIVAESTSQMAPVIHIARGPLS